MKKTCDHSKIPFGGHCGWDHCPNYRGRCASHIRWTPTAYTDECRPIVAEMPVSLPKAA